jgi:hypothetical protein
MWGNPCDFSGSRRLLETAYKSISNQKQRNQSNDLVLANMRTIHVFAQAGIHQASIAELINTFTPSLVRQLSIREFLKLIHSASLLAGLLDEEALAALWDEISVSSRLSELRDIADFEAICVVLESMRLLNIKHLDLFQTCADNLALLIRNITADRMIVILDVMDTLGMRHTKLLDSIISILPIVPCSDEELTSTVNYLVKMEAGTEDDRSYLQNLVRLRLASIV